jgi:hypothetical protein
MTAKVTTHFGRWARSWFRAIFPGDRGLVHRETGEASGRPASKWSRPRMNKPQLRWSRTNICLVASLKTGWPGDSMEGLIRLFVLLLVFISRIVLDHCLCPHWHITYMNEGYSRSCDFHLQSTYNLSIQFFCLFAFLPSFSHLVSHSVA